MKWTVVAAFLLLAVPVEGAEPYTGVISDGHGHLDGEDADPESIIEAMDRNNVDRVVVWPKSDGGWTDNHALDFARSHPDRVVAGISFQQEGWRNQDAGFMEGVRRKASSGNFGWLGEAAFRGGVGGKLHAPPDSPMWLRLQDIAADSGLPVTVHHNPYEKSDTGYERIGEFQLFVETLSHNPRARIVWAHWCGLSAAVEARKLLEKFANLHCDLAWLFKKQNAFPNPLVDKDHNFLPAWKDLIEDFPERFLVGIDTGGAPKKMAKYDDRVSEIRTALGGLSPGTARKVATGNFHRLMSGAITSTHNVRGKP